MRLPVLTLLFLLLVTPAHAQFQIDTKALLEDYSLELFTANATGFMSPLVIVSNLGANDGFYNRATVPKHNELYFDISVRTMMAWVLDDEREFTAVLPLEDKQNPHPVLSDEWLRVAQLNYFKLQLRGAAEAGELETRVRTATVFGGAGSGFTIPKEYIRNNVSGIDSATLERLPSQLSLTPGTNQDMVIAAVPQLTIGSFYSTEMLLRYVPPVVFDENIGKFSFFGIAFKHAFTNWIPDAPVHAAVQIGYQHSTIKNEVGYTKAKLEATTDLLAVNVHASRRFAWIEPYAGFSYEQLSSEGSYTFTLPQNIREEIGYDIDPQKAPVSLEDSAVKLTLGVTGYAGPMQIFAGIGIAKHMVFSGGIAYRFHSGVFLDSAPTAY
ncbi:MAG: hypothetical protein RBU27_03330 [Bacteroidota bacterium]|jgi:hypothetical protein|nr:hypothetical protein [Bacteroidota bacterium]